MYQKTVQTTEAFSPKLTYMYFWSLVPSWIYLLLTVEETCNALTKVHDKDSHTINIVCLLPEISPILHYRLLPQICYHQKSASIKLSGTSDGPKLRIHKTLQHHSDGQRTRVRNFLNLCLSDIKDSFLIIFS